MKKLLVMLLSLGMILSFTACGDDPAEEVPEPTPEKTEEVQEEIPEEKEEAPAIKGSQVYDIVESLDGQGIPKADAVRTDDGYQFDSSTTDYAYSIMTDSHHQVMSATFNVFTEDEGYLSYCASMPYDDADSDKAAAWVNENIGTEAKTKIGDAEFILSNGTSGPILTIQAVGFEDYVMSKM